MQITKIQHGLLEQDNFYITSPASDFLGSGTWSRSDNVFKLKSGEIKRKLPYNDFLIEVQKEPIGTNFEFFLEDNKTRLGLKEIAGDENIPHWKIIYYDNFIQVYSSIDGIEWINKGGSYYIFEGDILQGFSVKDDELVLTDYKIYSSPYLKIQNFEPDTKAELYNPYDILINTKTFNQNHECNLFLENNLQGYIKFIYNEELVYKTPLIDFFQGDIFLFSENNLRLVHKDQILDYKTTFLDSTKETFVLKNIGNEETNDINIDVINKNNDTIHLSFDDQEYKDLLNINSLLPNQEITFYLKIIKNNEGNFKKKDFEINIF